MSDTPEIPRDVQSIAELIVAMYSDGERTDKLEQARRQVVKGRAAVDQCAEQLDRLYNGLERSDHDADSLVKVAEIVRQREESEREKLLPGIEGLKHKHELAIHLGKGDAESRRLVEESIAIGEAWLALFAILHKKLLRLAAERRTASGDILRARPVSGEVDHEALSREFMARFPKIRAALAK